jgi:DNA polymerase V
MEDAPPANQEIAYTRSFGQPVTSLADLTQAVTEFASGAAAKLRLQSSKAGRISVFIHTSPFRPPPHCSRHTTVPLLRPTSDTQHLVKAAVMGLRAIYLPGYNFIKAGVMLLELQDDAVEQFELGLEPESAARGHLMETMDRLNDRYGRGTLKVASAGTEGKERAWSMRQMLLTPAYTTRWDQMPVAKS